MYVLIIGTIYYIYLFFKSYNQSKLLAHYNKGCDKGITKAIIHSDGLILHIINFQSALSSWYQSTCFCITGIFHFKKSSFISCLRVLQWRVQNGRENNTIHNIKSILVQVLILTIFFRKIPFQCIPYLTYGTSKSLDHEIHLKEAVKKYLQKNLPHHTFSKYPTFLPKW